MEKLIITDNQSVLATAVAATLSGAITTANGSMRTRTVDAADPTHPLTTNHTTQELTHG